MQLIEQATKAVFIIVNDQKKATGFSVTNNILVTARHNIYDKETGKYQCSSLQIKNATTTVSCKRVIKCHTKLDMCMLETNEFIDTTLAIEVGETNYTNEVISSIGNENGNGLVVSKGRGFDQKTGRHYTPISKGHSGGPLFNANYEVIGMNIRQSVQTNNEKAFNIAIPGRLITKFVSKYIPKIPVQIASSR